MIFKFYKIFFLSLFLVMGGFLFFVAQASAATIYANSSIGNDGAGDGSSNTPYKTFHKAYTEAGSGDIIDLSGTFTWTDADETGDVLTTGYTLAKNLTINGQGAGETIIQADTTPNSAEMRIFTISNGYNITIQNITLRHGHQISTSGSCLYITSGSLTILNSYLYQNNNSEGTEYNSVGVYMGDDRYNAGVIVAGGASFVARNTTFANNTNPYTAVLTVSATNSEITNCTFFGNNATYETAYITGGTSLWTNNTIYETDYFVSGSVLVWGGSTNAYFKNNLIQGTSGLEAGGSGIGHDGGYNIIKSVSSISITNGVNGNIVGDQGFNLKLSTNLATNGATNDVPNLVLLEGSVAIDAGDSAAYGPVGGEITPPSTDQRGKDRYNTTYDVGSVEYRGSTDIGPYLVSSSLDSENRYLDITFSEGVYGTSGGSGALETSDFDITFNANTGGATGVVISSVTTNTGNTALSGGETTVRLHLSVSGNINGVETIVVYPATSASIYDSDGNSVSRMDETSEHTLNGYFEYYVDPSGTDDSSHGTSSGADAWATIQYAVSNVEAPTTAPIRINIGAGTYTTNNDDIDIDRNFTDLILQGANAATTIVQPHADVAFSTAGNFDIGTSENVTINDMTIRYGRVDSGSGINIGGSGSLHVNRVHVDDCDGTTVGGIVAGSRIIIDGSTISNSDATGGTTFMRSGLYISAANSVITNSTLFNNRANGSQSASNGYISSSGDLTMINVTVVGGGTTGSYGNFMVDNGGELYVKNSIFANKDQGSYDIYEGTSGLVSSGGYNIFETYSGFTPAATDLKGNQVDLNIDSSLALNNTESGVPTLALQIGSVAINAGNSDSFHGTSVPGADQRTATRVDSVDIGAYEYGGVVSAPYVTSFYPVDDATGIAVNSNLLINFNEAVDAEVGSVKLYKSDNTLIETFNVVSDMSGSGTKIITINPNADLDSLTSYYVQIDATAFDDSNSNSYSGISDETTWTFTTIDSTAPTITSITSDKNNGTYTIGEVIDLDVTFSEAVTSTGDVTVTLETGDTDRTCTFSITSSTTGTCDYTVQAGDTSLDLDATVSGTIKDAANNVLTNFTPASGLASSKAIVIDTTSPIASLSPSDNSTGVVVDSDLVLSFSEDVTASSGNIVVYKASDDSVVETISVDGASVISTDSSTITIDLSSDLDYETEYYVLIDSATFVDGVSNEYAGIISSSTWSFTTQDTPTCPVIANAATYNSYPACGVTTCNSGYTLTGGTCESASGFISPVITSVGKGAVDLAIPMSNSKSIGEVKTSGVNVLMYVESKAMFNAISSKSQQVQGHSLRIVNIDMNNKKITVEISSEPQIVELDIDEEKEVDLDGDGVSDIKLNYNDLVVNRVDLTVEQIDLSNSSVEVIKWQEGDLVKEFGKSAVYIVNDGKKHPFFNAQAFLSGGYNWSDIKEVNDLSNLSIGDFVYKKSKNQVKTADYIFNSNLYYGVISKDVKYLQEYLNNNGYKVSESGLGSSGQETSFFGFLTEAALIRFQEVNKIEPALGFFGPITREFLNNKNINSSKF